MTSKDSHTETERRSHRKARTGSKARPGATADDPIELLISQHRDVEELFSEIEATGKNGHRSKEQLVEALVEALTLHTRLEEELFYPAAKDIDDEAIFEATEEHANVKSMLQRLSSVEPSDDSFEAKVKVLKELVSHHVKEEEKVVFPECRESMDASALSALGERMHALLKELQTGSH